MSKAPDLSAFPIPRKGGARPIDADETVAPALSSAQSEGEGAQPPTPAPIAASPKTATQSAAERSETQQRLVVDQIPAPAPYGQTVATTVKLDENRYLRLADAGRPGPGRLKRRTIQEMVIEALDEWFERRGI